MHTSSSKDSAAFCTFLEALRVQAQGKRVHLALDNGPIHKSRMRQAALTACGNWLCVEWLPTYAPERNDSERDWRHLKCHYLAQHTFLNIDRLDRAVHNGVQDINRNRLQHGQH